MAGRAFWKKQKPHARLLIARKEHEKKTVSAYTKLLRRRGARVMGDKRQIGQSQPVRRRKRRVALTCCTSFDERAPKGRELLRDEILRSGGEAEGGVHPHRRRKTPDGGGGKRPRAAHWTRSRPIYGGYASPFGERPTTTTTTTTIYPCYPCPLPPVRTLIPEVARVVAEPPAPAGGAL